MPVPLPIWLVKSEPETYAFADLMRDGQTVWDGVRNHQAAMFLKAMREGDQVLFYHSGASPAVVGVAKVVREAFPDPSDSTQKFVAIELAEVGPLAHPVPLSALKAEPALAEMRMLRQGRLSVSPVTPDEAAAILKLSDSL